MHLSHTKKVPGPRGGDPGQAGIRPGTERRDRGERVEEGDREDK
jgi:hypothetical protein